MLTREGFDVKIGNGIIIEKNGFKYSISSDRFIKMCELLTEPEENDLAKNIISSNGTERTSRNSD